MRRGYRRYVVRGGEQVGKKTEWRDGRGRYAGRPSLDALICPECGSICLPETVNEGTDAFPFLVKRYPANCHNCGHALDVEATR